MAFDVKQFVNDLQSINPKNPGGWPWPVKIFFLVVVFVVVLVGGWFGIGQAMYDELLAKKDEEEKLKTTFLEKKKRAVNLDLIQKQLQDTKLTFSALLKQLPSKAEMDVLLADVNQAGLGRGLQFDLFKPGNELPVKNVLIEQPISIKVSGNYDDLGKFASDVSQLSRIVILGDITIQPTQGTGGNTHLNMDATARTYRYIDDSVAPSAPKPGGAK